MQGWEEPKSHMPHSQKTKTENRNNIVANTIKTLKMVNTKKNLTKKTKKLGTKKQQRQ